MTNLEITNIVLLKHLKHFKNRKKKIKIKTKEKKCFKLND